jgi:hypothetical protein
MEFHVWIFDSPSHFLAAFSLRLIDTSLRGFLIIFSSCYSTRTTFRIIANGISGFFFFLFSVLFLLSGRFGWSSSLRGRAEKPVHCFLLCGIFVDKRDEPEQD